MKILMIAPFSFREYAAALETKLDKEVEPTRAWSRFHALENGVKSAGEQCGVAIHSISGAIHKNWYDGTIDLMENIRRAENNECVSAHVLEIDSAGGEATNCETVANFIRNEVKKPIVAVVNGMCCSAAYYIACGCNKIYATQSTDIFGSIGIMMTFKDWSEYYKEAGITEHEVYADQSSEKNSMFKQALEGKYEALKEQLLNPAANAFIEKVKSFRKITDDDSVFKGTTYMSEAAQAIGLIDGIKTYAQVIDLLSKNIDKSNKRKMVNLNIGAKAFLSTIGISADTIGLVDGKATLELDATQIKALDAACSTIVVEAATPPAIVHAASTPGGNDDYLKMKATMETILANQEKIMKQAGAPPLQASSGDAQDNPPATSFVDELRKTQW